MNNSVAETKLSGVVTLIITKAFAKCFLKNIAQFLTFSLDS